MIPLTNKDLAAETPTIKLARKINPADTEMGGESTASSEIVIVMNSTRKEGNIPSTEPVDGIRQFGNIFFYYPCLSANENLHV